MPAPLRAQAWNLALRLAANNGENIDQKRLAYARAVLAKHKADNALTPAPTDGSKIVGTTKPDVDKMLSEQALKCLEYYIKQNTPAPKSAPAAGAEAGAAPEEEPADYAVWKSVFEQAHAMVHALGVPDLADRKLPKLEALEGVNQDEMVNALLYGLDQDGNILTKWPEDLAPAVSGAGLPVSGDDDDF